MKIKSWLLLITCILVCQSAGIIGSVFTVSAIPTWYAGLVKPSFSPPNWLFGPAWTILYTLMGIAVYKILIKGFRKPGVKKTVYIFTVHLILNMLWSIIFFGSRQIGLALFEIGILWIFIAYLIVLFKKTDKAAAYLMVPYLLWVTFATLLNYSIWILNK